MAAKEQLTAWAKQEAEREFGATEFWNDEGLSSEGAEWGILHLAEVLQREDVRVAGIIAGDDHEERFSFESPTGKCECSTREVEVFWSREHQVNAIVAAMFAKVEGGTND